MDENKSNGQFPVPGIALVLIALGLFVYSDNPFNSTRPDPSSRYSPTAEDVRARLWQDPFDAVEKHRAAFDAEIEKPTTQPVGTQIAQDYLYQDETHVVCVMPGESLDEKNKAHSYGELACRIDRDKATELKILAVMVPGGNYAEDNEARIRSRYAVVSSLSKADYIPKDAGHIGFMNFASLCRSAINGKGVSNDKYEYCQWPATIPYEWFVNKTRERSEIVERNILVLWVDDSVVAKNNPLQMLNSIRSKITKNLDEDDKKYSFDVIGPASSTTLINMYEEAYRLSCVSGEANSSEKGRTCSDAIINDFEKHDIKIYSPKATMDDVGINKYINKKDDANIDWLNIERTIPGDDELVEALLNELLRRGINPYKYIPGEDSEQSGHKVADYCNHKLIDDFKAVDACEDINGIDFNRAEKQDHIVLIGEWDTVYSRNFNDLFRRNIRVKSEVDDVDWLHSYNYLRGIDGATSYKDSSDKSKKSDGQDGEKEIRRPVGENQYDYLRNIGDQVSHLNDSLAGSGSVRAIGIVGSDAYDKLLVLQALRERFQDVVFFTTDLDSRMLHKSENKWVRNLVVASGFGLSPQDENHYEITTFRDSYQTSLYLSVLKAIGYSPKKMSNEHECNIEYGVVSDVFGNAVTAKIFEVGNNQAIEYTPRYFIKVGSGYLSSYNPYMYIALFIVLFSLVFYQVSYPSRIILLVTVGVIFSMAVITLIFDAGSSIEFNVIFSGTSIWPAILIRMSAAFLALVFIFYTLKCLRVNTKEIIKKYDLKRTIKSCSVRLKDLILIDTWDGKNSGLPVSSVSELMCQYLKLASFGGWFSRVTVMTLVYMGISFAFLTMNGFPYTPFHGEISYSLSSTVIKVCVFLYLFLVFLVVDITRLYARFVKLLSSSEVNWPSTLIEEYCKKYGITKDIAKEKLKLNLIVHRSKSVDVLIFLPFVILSLMIISRSSFFDRWHMPVGLAVIIVLGALFALSSAIRLRRTAETARKHVLSSLVKLHKEQVYKEAKCELVKRVLVDDFEKLEGKLCEYKLASRLRRVIDEIRSIRDGPFSPITQHPIFSAIAMPFGGVGGLYLIDYLSNLGM